LSRPWKCEEAAYQPRRIRKKPVPARRRPRSASIGNDNVGTSVGGGPGGGVNVGGIPVGVLVGVFVGVLVGVLVGVSVGVLVGVFVGVSVGVFVGVPVGVFVGVSVGVLVGVSVGVFVGVSVGVLVGVSVGVFVGVSVGVGVGVHAAIRTVPEALLATFSPGTPASTPDALISSVKKICWAPQAGVVSVTLPVQVSVGLPSAPSAVTGEPPWVQSTEDVVPPGKGTVLVTARLLTP
jgi:hypothetical protein